MATVLEADRKPRGPGGRPSKFTAAFEAAFLEGIRAGIPEAQLLGRHGVSDGALRKWLQCGARGDPRFRAFLARYQAARAALDKARTIVRVADKGFEIIVRRRRGYTRLPDAVLPHAKAAKIAPGEGPEG
jgi:hypothetical protein